MNKHSIRKVNDMKGGFIGKFVRIDLSERKIKLEKLDERIARLFLGGNGYPSWILVNEVGKHIDPLGSKNKFIIFTGPLTGTICPGTDSWVGCFKSPLTGCWGESRCGGGFGPELKRAGYDGLVLEGKAADPVYICIRDSEVSIQDARPLWGKTVPETETYLKSLEGEDSRIISIGPAGENLVKFASVMSEGRAAGRCGPGAVLGSKKVKAVVVHGKNDVKVADMDAFYSLSRKIRIVQKDLSVCGSEEGAFGAGTTSWLPFFSEAGVIPAKYGKSNCWPGIGEAFYRDLREKYAVVKKACEGCTMGCWKICKVEDGEWATPYTDGPEYETVATFGHLMMNDQIEPIIYANYLCDSLGMDTISAGAVIAFGMECYEEGWLPDSEIENLELAWGNMPVVIELLKKIAFRQGCGDIFADGAVSLSKKIGGEAVKIPLHVKGLDIPAHDPRGRYAGKSWLLQYATGNRGACHIHPQEPTLLIGKYDKLGFRKEEWKGIDNPVSLEGKAAIVKWCQEFGDFQESLGTCKFHGFAAPAFTADIYASLLSAATGWEVDKKELFKIGERIFNAQRCFNVREGISRKDDRIPERFLKRPEFGPYKDSVDTETDINVFNTALDEYYRLRGWDVDTGIPGRAKFDELDIQEMYKLIEETKNMLHGKQENHED